MLIILLISVFTILKSANVHGYNKQRLLRLEISNNARVKYKSDYNPNSLLNFTERCQKYGYPVEVHEVITEDGYILKLFRMLKRPHCQKFKGPPVLLNHGLFMNAISYLDAGPATGIAYLLANQCLDLWCGNARGTEYSRNHTRLNPDKDPEFWQFSFHEIGLYDLPATIDYILHKTESKKLRYVGFSQSMSAYFVLNSLRPEYMEKIAVTVGMAPGIWFQPSSNPLLGFGVIVHKLIYTVLDLFGIQELLHTHSVIQEILHLICQRNLAARFCSDIISILDAPHTNSITLETIAVMFGHVPDGVSIKNLNHIAQNMASGLFRQYDYENDNFHVYGQKYPPVYNVKNITTPIYLIYGENDHMVNSSDVVALSKLLPNLKALYRIEDPKWNHIDFPWSKNIPKYVFPKIIHGLTNSILD